MFYCVPLNNKIYIILRGNKTHKLRKCCCFFHKRKKRIIKSLHFLWKIKDWQLFFIVSPNICISRPTHERRVWIYQKGIYFEGTYHSFNQSTEDFQIKWTYNVNIWLWWCNFVILLKKCILLEFYKCWIVWFFLRLGSTWGMKYITTR